MYPWLFGWLDNVPNLGAAIFIGGVLSLTVVVGVQIWGRR